MLLSPHSNRPYSGQIQHSKLLSQQLSRVNDSLITANTKDTLTSEQRYKHILNFKDFKGFRKIKAIKDRYKIGHVLGEGSFG
jgi:hypothetical protein